MKYMIPLIMSLCLSHLCMAQHISDFEGLSPGTQDSNLYLPSSHTFQFIIEEGDALNGGGTLGGQCDFAGYVPRQNSSKFGVLSVNSEDVPGGVALIDLEFDDVLGKWIIKDSNAVNFDFDIWAEDLFPGQIGSTLANCSGTVTPWNTVISCEEYTVDDIIDDYPFTPLSAFKVDRESDGYDVYGWAIEIDPITKEVIDQDGGRPGQDKLWAMGNFKHENAVVHQNRRTVYQGADATNGEGFLFKFVADEEENLSSGDLYVYKGDKKTNHSWIQIANTTIEEQNSTREQCLALGATNFGGIEDVEINPVDGMIYFAVKRESSDEFSNLGIVYRFRDTEPLDGSGLEDFEIYAGNKSYEVLPGVFEPWGRGVDNLVFDSLGNLWVAQDGDNSYIWVIFNGHTPENPNVKIFARTPDGSEPTGLTFSPDEKYIFMSIQHPSTANDATSQKDAAGKDVTFDNDVVIVLSRSEHMGTDQTQTDQPVMISQYFNDPETNSKWLELVNISDQSVSEGSYFLSLYENGSPEEILSASPKVIQVVPALDPGEVLLFKNSQNPLVPLTQNLGNATQLVSPVADFDDDDVVIITSSPGDYGYINRRDILGDIQAQPWGMGNSFLRGANSSEVPERDYNESNWILLDSLKEVSSALSATNLALGTHRKGKTVWNGSNWSRLEPDRSRAVEIEADFSAGQTDFQAYDLKVGSGVKMTFENSTAGSNQNLMIFGALNVQGELIIGDTESLIFKSNNPSVSGEIIKMEHSAVHNDVFDITYWSPPVAEIRVDEAFVGVDPARIFYFDQSRDPSGDPDSDTYWDAWVTASGSMVPGQGYASQGPTGERGPHIVAWEGKPNLGTIVYSNLIFHNDSGTNENEQNDYNLVGNPYPAALDIEKFIEGNTTIDGTVYFWTHSTPLTDGAYSESDYAVYNRAGGVSVQDDQLVEKNIGSGQGFFVRAVEDGDLVFEPSMILQGANDQFFKKELKKDELVNRLWLNLKDEIGSFEQILLSFSENGSSGMDRGYDALYLEGGNRISFYSWLDEKKLIIQSLPMFVGPEEIELGIVAYDDVRELTISIDRVEGDPGEGPIYLEDKKKSILHDLSKQDYRFLIDEGEDLTSRFKLRFQEAVLSDEDNLSDPEVKIYQRESNLYVISNSPVIKLEVYDVLGRPLNFNHVSGKRDMFDLQNIPRGTIFLVQVRLENGRLVSKKLYRK